MEFLKTYEEDIRAFIDALVEFFKTIFGLLSGDKAEGGAEETTQA